QLLGEDVSAGLQGKQGTRVQLKGFLEIRQSALRVIPQPGDAAGNPAPVVGGNALGSLLPVGAGTLVVLEGVAIARAEEKGARLGGTELQGAIEVADGTDHVVVTLPGDGPVDVEVGVIGTQPDRLIEVGQGLTRVAPPQGRQGAILVGPGDSR